MEVVNIDEEDLEIELWLAYREGDRAAFTTIYRQHAKVVAKYAWAILQDPVAVEDILQETFLIAWEKRLSSRLTDESLLPWLLVVCRNRSRNYLRNARARARKNRAMAETAADSSMPSQGVAWIQSEIDNLSPTDAQLCRLCLVEGYSYAEAAKILDTSEGAVGKRLQRARATLRASLSSAENS
jgi:RNA polymerase sigma factor (sigma-70 family)